MAVDAAQGNEVRLATANHEQPPLWRDPLFWLALALSIFAIAPLLQPGYFWGANDARHHVYFLFEYIRLVEDGIWWPRWSPDFAFGYGYPFFNIYGPFSHFLAAVLYRFLGFDYVGAVEAVFVLSIAGSAGAMYAFARDWLGRHGGLIAALVYVYIPYHLLNLFVRANLAESMAFVWMPLCLWAVRRAVVQPRFSWVLATAVCYAGLMLTSNLVIVLFTPLLGLYWLTLVFTHGGPQETTDLSLPRRARAWMWLRSALPAAGGLVAGVGLSAIFWLPMLLERQYVRVDQWFDGRYDYQGNFVYFSQLFSPRWGFGISQPGPDDPMGFQLGAVALIFAAVGVPAAWVRMGRRRWEAACFALGAIGATFVATTWGSFLWELPVIGTVLGFAQFPWRWFSVSALCLSILAGLALHPVVTGLDDRRHMSMPLLAAIAVILVGSYPMLRVEITEPAEGPVSLAALMRFQRSADEMTGSTAWVRQIPYWSPMADYYIAQDAAGGPVMPVETKLDYSQFDYESFAGDSVAHNTVMEEVYFFNETGQEQRLVFNHFYYPGWRAYLLDGRHGEKVTQLPVIPEETGTLGRMTVPVPPGDGYVLLEYGETPPRTIGRMITLATLGILLLTGLILALRRTPAETAA